MNILLMDGLPEEYEGVEISADFRNMIQVDLILRDDKLSDIEKTMAALNQLYPVIPNDIQKAIDGLAWFSSRGQGGNESAGEVNQTQTKRGFCFEQDAGLIYSAFYSTYHISLTTVEFLHWWEFMALFEGLPEDTLIKKVIYWRTADVTTMGKEERKHVLKMRKQFALKSTEKPVLSAEEVERKMKERMAQRFAEAQATLEQKGG